MKRILISLAIAGVLAAVAVPFMSDADVTAPTTQICVGGIGC